MPTTLGKCTSKDLSDSLKKTYAKPSVAHTMQLRSRLCELKQGDLSVSEYCNEALLIKDELAAIGKEPTCDDFLRQVLTNLKSDLSDMCMSILARREVPDFEEVIDLLLSAESMVVHAHLPSPSAALLSPDPPRTASASANTVKRTPAPASDSAQGFGRGSARGRGGASSRQNNWYPDTGASHLVAPDLTQLQLHDGYYGSNQLRVVDGADSSFVVKDRTTKKIPPRGPASNGLYLFPPSARPVSSSASHFSSCPTTIRQSPFMSTEVSLSVWHHRLGHPNVVVLRKVLGGFFLGRDRNFHFKCTSCSLGKLCCQSFPLSLKSSTSILQLLFMDVWGPSPHVSSDGNRYYLSIVDAYSRFIWIFCCSAKSDVYSLFLRFQKLVECQFNVSIKSVQTDGGGEFKALTCHFQDTCIVHHISCPYTHHQMGRVEHRRRHIVDVGLTLLAYSGLSFKYWQYAFETAIYVINRLSSIVNPDMSPYQLL
ncbi:hypothetical protein LIER_36729 [Lithospermum erythrorhizon]|uniref:Integrase catalytic domain-containing protein n=1 Tax=Lithospermum erythrorhizon TaxID=34254 RepID=A0AAV3PA16_LITER